MPCPQIASPQASVLGRLLSSAVWFRIFVVGDLYTCPPSSKSFISATGNLRLITYVSAICLHWFEDLKHMVSALKMYADRVWSMIRHCFVHFFTAIFDVWSARASPDCKANNLKVAKWNLYFPSPGLYRTKWLVPTIQAHP